MKNDSRVEMFCTEFVDLADAEKDYIHGISKALAFALQNLKQSSSSETAVPCGTGENNTGAS
jgi:hypothetical protein